MVCQTQFNDSRMLTAKPMMLLTFDKIPLTRNAWYNSGMEGFLKNVGDLPAAARSVVEGLMGHALREEQRLYIVAMDPPAEPSTEDRRAAWAELQISLDEMQANSLRSGLSTEQIELAIDEACDEVRYGSKPCG